MFLDDDDDLALASTQENQEMNFLATRMIDFAGMNCCRLDDENVFVELMRVSASNSLYRFGSENHAE